MRDETKTAAKFSRYDVREEYAHLLDEQARKAPAENAALYEEGYIIALRQGDNDEGLWCVAGDGKDETTVPHDAMSFDTYADAVRYMVEHCEIPNMPAPIPRGFERPKFPRVCYYRLYEEITEL